MSVGFPGPTSPFFRPASRSSLTTAALASSFGCSSPLKSRPPLPPAGPSSWSAVRSVSRQTAEGGLAARTDHCVGAAWQARRYALGVAMLFDDSFLHEVHNRSSADRAVLICDLWHPALSAAEISRWVLAYSCTHYG